VHANSKGKVALDDITLWANCHRIHDEQHPQFQLFDPVPLTFWTQNRQDWTQCRELLLCQVSSHSDQGFSFHRANIHTNIYKV